MQEGALPDDGGRKGGLEVEPGVERLSRPDEDVSRDAQAPEQAVRPLRHPVRGLRQVGQDKQQVIVAVGAGLAPGPAVNPKNVVTLMLVGVIHQQRGDIPQAQAAYEKILALNPRFAPAANNLASPGPLGSGL